MMEDKAKVGFLYFNIASTDNKKAKCLGEKFINS